MRGLAAFVLSVVVALASGCAAPPPPSFVVGPKAERSEDGLQLLENGRFQRAWARPGAAFSRYHGVWPQFLGIHYREDPHLAESWARRSNYPLPEGLRRILLGYLHEAFDESIASSEDWQPAGGKGHEVLLARVALVDLVLNAPLRPLADDDGVWIDSVGELTFVVELLDSETGEVVLRAAERRAIAPESGRPIQAAPGPTEYESRRLFREWAQKLVSLLEAARVADLSEPPVS